MNTKSTKYFSLLGTIVFIASLASYVYFSKTTQRNIATENSAAQNLTEIQKQKWALVESFQIRQTNQSLQIDVPHLVDLCADNIFLIFQLSAYEVSVAGNSPQIHLRISCNLALEKMQTQFEVSYSDLGSLHQLKEIKWPFGEISTELIYTDEEFPIKWSLTEISTEGANSFQINQFEIQKVFGNNFEFELRP